MRYANRLVIGKRPAKPALNKNALILSQFVDLMDEVIRHLETLYS